MATVNKPKILHLLSQRPDSTGSGIYIQAMIREAAAAGYENYLVAGVAADFCEGPDCIEADKTGFVRFQQDELSFLLPGMSDVMPYESTRFCDLSFGDIKNYEAAFTHQLQKAVDHFQPNLIHSHHLWLVSSLTRRLYPDIPMVTTCHGSDLRQFQNCPHLQKRVLAGCRLINRVMALSKAQKEEIIRLYGLKPDKVVIVGAGYNDALFYPETKPAADPVQLVYAGKLSFAKGVPWFLRALQTISEPSWKLHLIGGGSGSEKEACLKLANGLNRKVQIHGALSQADLAAIVRQAHILVLPSFYEGLPLVLLEGLAGGCCIVATDLPGARELFDHTDTDLISLVKTPRLHRLDQPYEEDEAAFEKELQQALEKQIKVVVDHPQIDLSMVQPLLNAYTWKGVFQKVNEIYQAFLS